MVEGGHLSDCEYGPDDASVVRPHGLDDHVSNEDAPQAGVKHRGKVQEERGYHRRGKRNEHGRSTQDVLWS